MNAATARRAVSSARRSGPCGSISPPAICTIHANAPPAKIRRAECSGDRCDARIAVPDAQASTMM
ncbi:hypothetical protein [Lysobacter sp. TY2-98]|uniref:hypothetical protein n=1 Tax=Lysobacter sp. TY2-98 TaxID=2290922 RepID=UPI0013B38D3E|nr:hypothetical protein [Lysobacter sp. TY2-98]